MDLKHTDDTQQCIESTTKFYKVLRNDLTHYGFKYQLGLNIDTVPFDPSGSCKPGGLYYTTAEHLHEFLHFGHQIADVEIPADAKTYVDPQGNKSKADRLIITKLTPTAEHPLFKDEKFCIKMLEYNGYYLDHIKKQTPHMCMIAVQSKPYALAYVLEQTEPICKLAISKDPNVAGLIRDKSLRNVVLGEL